MHQNINFPSMDSFQFHQISSVSASSTTNAPKVRVGDSPFPPGFPTDFNGFNPQSSAPPPLRNCFQKSLLPLPAASPAGLGFFWKQTTQMCIQKSTACIQKSTQKRIEQNCIFFRNMLSMFHHPQSLLFLFTVVKKGVDDNWEKKAT